MVDDLKTSLTTSTSWMPVPEQWMHIPGGPLKIQSWNKTKPGLLDSPSSPHLEDNYIVRSTYFQYQANLSAIEYIPVTTGKLHIDILTPRCPSRRNAEGLIVKTWWCPLTGACEEFCDSALQFQSDWLAEWGPEFECRASGIAFCSLEGMCDYNNACPFDPVFKFGGSSLMPHAPKTISELEDPTVTENVQWDYKINKTFEIVVKSADLWELQTLDILREYFYDPEREQDRKTHNERYCFGGPFVDLLRIFTIILLSDLIGIPLFLASGVHLTGRPALPWQRNLRCWRTRLVED